MIIKIGIIIAIVILIILNPIGISIVFLFNAKYTGYINTP